MDRLIKKAGVLSLMVVGLLVSQPVIQVAQAKEDIEFQQVFKGVEDIEGVIGAVLTQESKADELGLFPSVMIAQALYESANGRSFFAKESNNLYGLKEGTGMATFNTPGDGVLAYLELLTNGHYSQYGISEKLTPEEQIDALVKSGWSSNGTVYAIKLKAIIEKHDLTKYDN